MYVVAFAIWSQSLHILIYIFDIRSQCAFLIFTTPVFTAAKLIVTSHDRHTDTFLALDANPIQTLIMLKQHKADVNRINMHLIGWGSVMYYVLGIIGPCKCTRTPCLWKIGEAVEKVQQTVGDEYKGRLTQWIDFYEDNF